MGPQVARDYVQSGGERRIWGVHGNARGTAHPVEVCEKDRVVVDSNLPPREVRKVLALVLMVPLGQQAPHDVELRVVVHHPADVGRDPYTVHDVLGSSMCLLRTNAKQLCGHLDAFSTGLWRPDVALLEGFLGGREKVGKYR